MRPKRTLALVFGSLIGLVALALMIGGAGLTWAHATQRDGDGFYSSGTERFASSGYALVSSEIDLGVDQDGREWLWIDDVGVARVRAELLDGGDLFVGIADADAVDAYLAGVDHDEVVDLADRPFTPTYRRHRGDAVPAPPADQTFWAASAEGVGPQTIRWDIEQGDWKVVLMNADAEPAVAVNAAAGVKTGLLLPIGLALAAVALVLGAGAVGLIVYGARTEPAVAPAAGAAPVPAGTSGGAAYPVRLEGRLDEDLSRGLWLVKWFLAIPHLLVLALLWTAMVVVTIVAGISVLFTGRYPVGAFRFDVGVLRWTWRVTFYAFVLGTDRYPPFTLEDDPDYPARLEIDEPGELSRPLVLVKPWLLALPHWLILSVFGGGTAWWAWGTAGDDARVFVGGGLIGLLALIAGVALLFTGRYPRSLFDFIMGMERWTYRVIGYAALMTDRYPPFRLDPGGAEPAMAEAERPPSPAPAEAPAT